MGLIKNIGKSIIESFLSIRSEVSYNVSGKQVEYKRTSLSELEFFQRGFKSDLPAINSLIELTTQKDCIWDIGANVGHYTYALDIHPPNVVAFEPYPHNIPRLVQNRKLNNLDTDIYTFALAEKNGCETFDVPIAGMRAAQGSLEGDYQQSGDAIGVATISGDYLIDEVGISKPTVLKIDVEGAALRVLNGLEDNIESVHTIYVEPHGNEDKVKSFLKANGMSINSTGQDIKGLLFTRD